MEAVEVYPHNTHIPIRILNFWDFAALTLTLAHMTDWFGLFEDIHRSGVKLVLCSREVTSACPSQKEKVTIRWDGVY